jgi:hypothetical protein
VLTIFSIPKPFTDPHIATIQTNAILSWLNLGKGIQVILIGNDSGVAEFCEKHGIIQLADVKSNEFGTPLLNSAFELARKKARYDLLTYINADIILTSAFLKIFDFLPGGEFLAVGRRWDIDLDTPLDYSNDNWEEKLQNQIKLHGSLHSVAGSDYFIFRKNSFQDLPDFAVGRVGWDNWMIASSLKKHLPVIDLSRVLTVIHQNHGYQHKEKYGFALEDKKNLSFLRDKRDLQNTDSADYYLTASGLKKKSAILEIIKRLPSQFAARLIARLLKLCCRQRPIDN